MSTARTGKIFYGWWIVLSCSVLSLYGAGIFYYGFSTFVKPVVLELGWSMAAISGAFSLYRLEAGIAAPLVGYALDKYGPRKLTIVSGIIMGGGFIYLSTVQTVIPFYAAIIISSLGWSGCSGASMGTPLVGKWFVRTRGRALGIYSAARSLAGIVVPVVAYLIVQYGWRNALVILGILSWLLIPPLAFVLKPSPEECGLLPDGEPTQIEIDAVDGTDGKAGRGTEVHFSVRNAMSTKAFWIITMCLIAHQIAQSAIFVHLVPYLIDVGIEATAAASVVSLIALASVLGRYGSGWLGDLVNKKWLLFGLFFLQPIGILSLMGVHQFTDVIPFVLIYSTAYGGTTVVKAAIVGDYYGRKNFGTIFGLVQGVSTAGSFFGPLIAGFVYDRYGSYDLAFTSFSVMMFFVSLVVLLLKPPALPSDTTGDSGDRMGTYRPTPRLPLHRPARLPDDARTGRCKVRTSSKPSARRSSSTSNRRGDLKGKGIVLCNL